MPALAAKCRHCVSALCPVAALVAQILANAIPGCADSPRTPIVSKTVFTMCSPVTSTTSVRNGPAFSEVPTSPLVGRQRFFVIRLAALNRLPWRWLDVPSRVRRRRLTRPNRSTVGGEACDFNRALGMASDSLRHTFQYKSGYALASMGAHHDQVGFAFGRAIGRMCSHQSPPSAGAQRPPGTKSNPTLPAIAKIAP